MGSVEKEWMCWKYILGTVITKNLLMAHGYGSRRGLMTRRNSGCLLFGLKRLSRLWWYLLRREDWGGSRNIFY